MLKEAPGVRWRGILFRKWSRVKFLQKIGLRSLA